MIPILCLWLIDMALDLVLSLDLTLALDLALALAKSAKSRTLILALTVNLTLIQTTALILTLNLTLTLILCFFILNLALAINFKLSIFVKCHHKNYFSPHQLGSLHQHQSHLRGKLRVCLREKVSCPRGNLFCLREHVAHQCGLSSTFYVLGYTIVRGLAILTILGTYTDY
jgi:hypothetical protein